MIYQFMQEVYRKCNYSRESAMNSEEFLVQVDALIEKLNSNNVLVLLGFRYREFPQKVYKKLLKRLKCMERDCVDSIGGFKPRNDKAVKSVFGLETLKQVDIREVLFAYFLITETSLYEKNMEECISHVSLYRTLLETGGYEFNQDVYPYLRDYILMYVLLTNQNMDILVGLLKSGAEYEPAEKTDLTLELPYVGTDNNLSFDKWNKIIDAGMDGADNEKATRHSMSMLSDSLSEIVNDTNKLNKKKASEVFSDRDVQSINNTETRRKWYMFRMLSRIIDRQIDEILDDVEAYRDGRAGAIEKLGDAIKRCWLEKGEHESKAAGTWSQIGQNPRRLEGCSIEDIKNDLNQSHVNIGKIAATYDYYFDGSDYTLLNLWIMNHEENLTLKDVKIEALAEIDTKSLKDIYIKSDKELETRPPEEVEIEENEAEIEENRAEKLGHAFSQYKLRYEIYYKDWTENTMEIIKKDRGAYFGIRAILTGERNVSREMLLLTALLSIAQGVDLREDYIKNHVLFNSRFPKEYRKYSVFDEYFSQTYEELRINRTVGLKNRIEILRKHSRGLEEQFLFEPMYTIEEISEKREASEKETDGVAVFHEILLGKRVE